MMENNLKDKNILVIVESPRKVPGVESSLKKAGYKKATVMASVGHIMKLYNGNKKFFNTGIYPEEDWRLNLKVDEDKTKNVATMKTKAAKADQVILMTDGDREGEVIAWSLIKFLGLKDGQWKRAITHEMTAKAIVRAIENPVELDLNLVEAGLTRMIEDKSIGYALSSRARVYMGAKSVGRVQSPVLKLIVEREDEINNFTPEQYFDLYLSFTSNGEEYQAKYIGTEDKSVDHLTDLGEVKRIMDDCSKDKSMEVSSSIKERQESPKPPYSTATFLQDATRRLGVSTKSATDSLKRLYEAGFEVNGEHVGILTYIRTDDTTLAPEFIPVLADYVKNTYGSDKYIFPRQGKKKGNEQEGHEALRCVDPEMTPDKLSQHIHNEYDLKVYKLIWQRTVASAMPNAIYADTEYIFKLGGKYLFSLTKSRLQVPGYREVYEQTAEPDLDENISANITDDKIDYIEKWTKPKPHYNETTMLKEMQELGIGRPSTYSPTIEKVLSKELGYCTLENKKDMIPTDKGVQLAKYLSRAFPDIINVKYTSEMEANLDKIASGELTKTAILDSFKTRLDEALENDHESTESLPTETKMCPLCGAPMKVRRSRFGKSFYGCSEYPKCKGLIGID